jgi:molybdopterin molybdotransferase
MITFEEAQQKVLASAAILDSQPVALLDAVGRVTARPLYAADDLVPFARSAMDGYAIASDDVSDTPTRLTLREPMYAERSVARRHVRGTATPIATGGPLPEGADAVLPIEDVERDADGIRFTGRIVAGKHVFAPGEDARAGDLLVPAGNTITPASLGLLASAGLSVVDVVRRPRIALVCSGEELVAVGAIPAFGQVRNSNAAMIGALVTAAGAEVCSSVWVRDDRHELSAAVSNALNNADVVITTGGASVGERDFMKPVMREAGVTFAFDGVALRPASPFAFGFRGCVLVAVLPGNPSSAFVALVEFVLPLIRALQGNARPRAVRVAATLRDRLHARPHRSYASFVALRVAKNGFEATPLPNQCSALTRTSAEAAGLAIVPPGDRDHLFGDIVDVDIIDWSRIESASAAFTYA